MDGITVLLLQTHVDDAFSAAMIDQGSVDDAYCQRLVTCAFCDPFLTPYRHYSHFPLFAHPTLFV